MKTRLRLFSFLGPILSARLPISSPAQAAKLLATPLSSPALDAPLSADPLFCQQAALFPANLLSLPVQADPLHAMTHSIHKEHQPQPHGLILCLPFIECPTAQCPRPPCSERAYAFVTRVLSTTENLAVIWPQRIIADHDCCRASVPESAPAFRL